MICPTIDWLIGYYNNYTDFHALISVGMLIASLYHTWATNKSKKKGEMCLKICKKKERNVVILLGVLKLGSWFWRVDWWFPCGYTPGQFSKYTNYLNQYCTEAFLQLVLSLAYPHINVSNLVLSVFFFPNNAEVLCVISLRKKRYQVHREEWDLSELLNTQTHL
jgi:hypothetical protein